MKIYWLRLLGINAQVLAAVVSLIIERDRVEEGSRRFNNRWVNSGVNNSSYRFLRGETMSSGRWIEITAEFGEEYDRFHAYLAGSSRFASIVLRVLRDAGVEKVEAVLVDQDEYGYEEFDIIELLGKIEE